MTKASDNAFPSLLLNEAAPPAAPAASKQRLYLNSSNLNVINSAGTIRVVGGGGSGSVATDVIWDAAGDLAVGTGADTAAKLTKGNAGAVLAMGNSAVIWNAGTAFPASKATNDRYWRTDLGIEYYWDGTRWLTTTFYTIPLSSYLTMQPVSGTTAGIFQGILGHSPTYDAYLYNVVASTYVPTTNNGSNYWTLTMINLPTGTTIATFNTSADTVGTFTSHVVAINALLGTTQFGARVSLTKTGTAGTFECTLGVTYRLVGT